MTIIRLIFVLLGLMIFGESYAQQVLPKGENPIIKKKAPDKKPGSSSGLSINAGLGVANYFGDLMQYNRLFSQSGFAFGVGVSYPLSNRFSTRLDIGAQQVKAADSKNKGSQYKARNLSFKSSVYDMSVSLDFNLINIDKHGFSPYVSAGVGAMIFNPTAEDISGNKQKLRELGTEGQGLAGYPGMYKKASFIVPLGLGVKIAAGNNVTLSLDFNYRITGTDYLDDVSTSGYPDKTLLDARNPLTARFTWRGNEVGGEAYPANLSLPRGNPANKDGYYTTRFKVAYSFAKKKKEKTPASVIVVNKPKEADRDYDGVPDAVDKCPDVKGSTENNGCPFAFVEGGELTAVSPDSMTYRIYFDFDRSLLLTEAFKTLKGIVGLLEADNSLKINITGHSDNLGTSSASMQLSADRANITRDYFLSYNVPADKITTAHYGETRPVDKEQQWRNRRVEITIIKK